MKILTIAALHIVLFATHTNAQSVQGDGKAIFQEHCVKCHGPSGDKGRFGAKNLIVSELTKDEARAIVQNGKRIMPAWKRTLTPAEIEQVLKYIIALRRRAN